jgi:L-2-hydroxyglutarate oxidase
MRLGKLDMRIIPFRGEYYELKPAAQSLVKHLIYPVPDPSFPFLGVHFTRMVQGGIEAGPNAVFALAREGYTWGDINLKELGLSLGWPGFRKLAGKYWKTGLGEMHRSLSKAAFTKALQRLIPELKKGDLVAAGSGVRAQACWKDGGLVDDFVIRAQAGEIHVLTARRPAATSSLAIGKHIAALAQKQMNP